MKKIILALMVMASSVGFAQDYNEEVDLYQALFGMQKKQVVSEVIKISDANTDAFWKLYDSYEAERKELAKKRFKVLEKYVEHYFELEGESLSKMLKESMANHNSYNKLINKYTNRISKSIGPKPAAQFYQFERYLKSIIQVELMNTMPMVGELEKK